MSNHQNEDGEYLMTAAELRLEWEIDQESAYERAYDNDRYDGYEPDEKDVDDCDHGDGSYPSDVAGFNCESGCYAEFIGPCMPPHPNDPEWITSGGFFTYEGTPEVMSNYDGYGNEDAYIDANMD